MHVPSRFIIFVKLAFFAFLAYLFLAWNTFILKTPNINRIILGGAYEYWEEEPVVNPIVIDEMIRGTMSVREFINIFTFFS
jgi:hypothetical protein